MALENMLSEEAEHIKQFIKNFIPQHKQHRWLTILSMKSEKWKGISAYDCNQPEASDWNTPVIDTIKKYHLEQWIDSDAYIYPIGHGGVKKGVFKSTLRKALVDPGEELECIISIIPGKLAVSYGHSNEFRLCKRT
jgi:hypothetical protein